MQLALQGRFAVQRSTWGTSLGEDKLGARARILNTKVACRANIPPQTMIPVLFLCWLDEACFAASLLPPRECQGRIQVSRAESSCCPISRLLAACCLLLAAFCLLLAGIGEPGVLGEGHSRRFSHRFYAVQDGCTSSLNLVRVLQFPLSGAFTWVADVWARPEHKNGNDPPPPTSRATSLSEQQQVLFPQILDTTASQPPPEPERPPQGGGRGTGGQPARSPARDGGGGAGGFQPTHGTLPPHGRRQATGTSRVARALYPKQAQEGTGGCGGRHSK